MAAQITARQVELVGGQYIGFVMSDQGKEIDASLPKPTAAEAEAEAAYFLANSYWRRCWADLGYTFAGALGGVAERPSIHAAK